MADGQQQTQQQSPDPSVVVKDPEFLKLPRPARHDVLRSVDPENYGKMPAVAQQQVLDSLPTPPETDIEKAPEKNTLGKGTGSKIVRGASLGAAQGLGLPMTTESSDFSLLPGMAHMIRHPIDSASLIGGSAIDAMKDRFEKAKAVDVATRRKPGEPMSAGLVGRRLMGLGDYLTYGLEGSIPFIGPAIGQMADTLESGIRQKDPEKMAESTGQALTTGLTFGLTKGAKAEAVSAADKAPITKLQQMTGSKISPAEANRVPSAGKIQPALANTPTEILNHAEQEGIQLTPAQATKNPVRGMVQAVGERSLLGAKTFADATEENAGKFSESVRNLQDRVDPKAMGLSPESAGESVQQSATVAKDVSHTNASNAYKQLPQVPIDTSGTAAAWQKARGGMPMGIEDKILAATPRNMTGFVSEILNPTGIKTPMTLDQGIALRSLLREMGDTVGADLPSRQQGIFKTLSEAADGDLAKATKIAGADKEWRSANAGWKDFTATYGDRQSPLNKILATKDPKQIINTIMSRRSAADIKMMQKENMTGGLEAIQRQVVEDIAKNNFGVGKNGMGGYSDGFLKTLFGPDVTKELYLKGELARRFKWQLNPSGTSNVLMGADQLQHPSRWMVPMGAAKASMPRSATSFLPNPPSSGRLFNIAPGLMSAPMLGQGSQPRGMLNQ